MSASVTFAGSACLNRPPRELVHCMQAPRLVPGDKVCCPIEGMKRRPLPEHDPFRTGRVIAAVNGHALVKIGDAFEWLPNNRLLRLEG
jgi:hypothetical protein